MELKISVQIHEHKSGSDCSDLDGIDSLTASVEKGEEHEVNQNLCISCIPGKHWFIGKVDVS